MFDVQLTQTYLNLSQYSVRYVILTYDSKSKTIHLEVSQNDKWISTVSKKKKESNHELKWDDDTTKSKCDCFVVFSFDNFPWISV